jgi:hypothetical protein
MRRRKFCKVYVTLFFLLSLPLSGQEEPAEAQALTTRYGFGIDMAIYSKNNIDGKSAGSFVGIGGLAGADIMGIAYYAWKIPFLYGENALIRNNNIDIRLQGGLSPAHVEALSTITFTPLAFLSFYAAGLVSTGWSLGSFATGLNANREDGLDRSSFQGVLGMLTLGGRFQFDLGALIDNPWTHVLLVSDNRFEYRHFSAVDNETPWSFKNDSGRNLNGWRYTASHILGYGMPFIVDMVGIITDTELNIGRAARVSPKESGWGSNFMLIKFGPMLNIRFNERHSLVILAQLKYDMLWNEASMGDDSVPLMQRSYKGSYVSFYRLGFSYRCVF